MFSKVWEEEEKKVLLTSAGHCWWRPLVVDSAWFPEAGMQLIHF
jgi:hypothetical protein